MPRSGKALRRKLIDRNPFPCVHFGVFPVVKSPYRTMTCTILSWIVLVCLPSHLLGQTKKGNMSPKQIWDGASLIVGGTIHNLTEAGGGYLRGMLKAEVVYKGSVPHDELIVRIYGPKEVPGRSAIWFFRGAPDGIPTESYPWFRRGPQLFLLWPSTIRERVLGRLEYASSSVVDDLQLFIIRAPGTRDKAVVIWIALVDSQGSASRRQQVPFASEPTLKVLGPRSKSVESTLQIPKRPQATSRSGSVRVLRRKDDNLLQQIIVSPKPLHGKYAITVEISLISQSKTQLVASLMLRY